MIARIAWTTRFWNSASPVAAVLSAALAASALTGCGEAGPVFAEVNGKVLLDGQPMTKGFVITQPPAGRGANGPIGPDGTFQLTSGREPGALVGAHQVAVVAYENPGAAGAEADMGRLIVPLRYTSPASSQLTIEVTESGPNNPVLNLTSK